MIPYFDAHCDTVGCCLDGKRRLRQNELQLDLVRDRAFSRRAQFFALFHDAAKAPADGMWAQCRRLYDCFCRETEVNGDLAVRCSTGSQIDAATATGKAAALLSIEGADLLECDLKRINSVAAWGVKLLNLTWNRANLLSGSHREDTERGLSQTGRAFVRTLESCAIYPDVSHLSDAGFWDLARMARRPIVASHSNARAVCPHSRNLTDDQFRAIRDLGGVAGLNFCPAFVDEHNPSLDALVRHAEHFLDLGGEKTLCIGGDLDGCEPAATGIAGTQDVPRLYEALAARGYSESLLNDIFWNNLRRLF
ncbi:MAG: membrane dipeptidase [Oscillospiraceae bacterium]|nr:membrane dipeptidase [Oscillospiraceae bacterium]